MQWVVVRNGSQNQIGKPLSLLVGERNGVIAGAPRQNKSRSSSNWFTNWLPTEPYEPPFCLRVVFDSSSLEETPYPGGGDAGPWHRMVEPLADVECESLPFEVIEHRPSQPFADPFRRLAPLILV